MRSRSAGALIALAAAALLATAACTDLLQPGAVQPPDSLGVQTLSMHALRVEWMPVDGEDVVGYRLERRADLTGPFTVVADNIQATDAVVNYFDEGLEPETFYGYRVLTLTRSGDVSSPSVVRAGRTSPRPSVVVLTQAGSLDGSNARDPDGYSVMVKNTTDSSLNPIGVQDARRVGPLHPGTWSVELRDVADHCTRQGTPLRQASVSDVGVRTQDTVLFQVLCVDPRFARLTTVVTVGGDSIDADGFTAELSGILADANLPDSARIVARTAPVVGSGGATTFGALAEGDYLVELSGIAAHCVVAGGPVRDAGRLEARDADTVRFALTCAGGPPPDTTRAGYRLRNSWGAVAAGRITLTLTADMGAFNDPAVNGAGADDLHAIQGTTQYDASRLRFLSAANVTGSGLQNVAVNGSAPGVVQWQNFSTQATPQTGVHGVLAMTFDVLASGPVTTRTMVSIAASQNENDLLANLVVVEANTSVGGGGPTNQAPSATANGPYAGTVGTPVAFNSTGSTDPDGSIASYSWSFGDGATAATAAPSHSYAAAGTYPVTLIVTDNLGATATAQTTAAVTGGGGGGSTPFTWSYVWGTPAADSIVTLTVTLDLSTNIPETPGVEELQQYVVDSLRWNPAMLQYFAFNHGPGGGGSVNTTFTGSGRLSFAGTLGVANRSGLIQVAVIRFKVIGSPGQQTTTLTSLGALTGTAATGSYAYRARTQIGEATLTVP